MAVLFGFSLRVSWICCLLIGGITSFPKAEGDRSGYPAQAASGHYDSWPAYNQASEQRPAPIPMDWLQNLDEEPLSQNKRAVWKVWHPAQMPHRQKNPHLMRQQVWHPAQKPERLPLIDVTQKQPVDIPKHVWRPALLSEKVPPTGFLQVQPANTPPEPERVWSLDQMLLEQMTPAGGEGGAQVLPEGGAQVLPEGGAQVLPEGGAQVLPEGGAQVLPEGGAQVLPEGGAQNPPTSEEQMPPAGGTWEEIPPEVGEKPKSILYPAQKPQQPTQPEMSKEPAMMPHQIWHPDNPLRNTEHLWRPARFPYLQKDAKVPLQQKEPATMLQQPHRVWRPVEMHKAPNQLSSMPQVHNQQPCLGSRCNHGSPLYQCIPTVLNQETLPREMTQATNQAFTNLLKGLGRCGFQLEWFSSRGNWPRRRCQGKHDSGFIFWALHWFYSHDLDSARKMLVLLLRIINKQFRF
ncbi:hypothetical protein DPEC_G00173110 [Dallia pectoralis]|uniref:Uncharacterized protein n=1 Tax=Dallia pectoralis TaxID=75939 RepID=A0ACC2GE54_DALPE|nr:hypothetical protein DPEC_G00173110 [Dallia pectoralis]